MEGKQVVQRVYVRGTMQRAETTAPAGGMGVFCSFLSLLFLYPEISFKKKTAPSFPKRHTAVSGIWGSGVGLMIVPCLILLRPSFPSLPFGRRTVKPSPMY